LLTSKVSFGCFFIGVPLSMEKTLGQIGFEAYGDHANWTAYDGKPMPRWDDNLRPDIKEKWEIAAKAIAEHVKSGQTGS